MARRRGAPVQPDVDDDDPRERKSKKLHSGNAAVDAAAALLEYARRRGYVVGPELTVTETSVTMQVRDLRIMKREGFVDPTDDDEDDDDEPTTLMDEHGAPKDPVPEGTTG